MTTSRIKFNDYGDITTMTDLFKSNLDRELFKRYVGRIDNPDIVEKICSAVTLKWSPNLNNPVSIATELFNDALTEGPKFEDVGPDVDLLTYPKNALKGTFGYFIADYHTLQKLNEIKYILPHEFDSKYLNSENDLYISNLSINHSEYDSDDRNFTLELKEFEIVHVPLAHLYIDLEKILTPEELEGVDDELKTLMIDFQLLIEPSIVQKYPFVSRFTLNPRSMTDPDIIKTVGEKVFDKVNTFGFALEPFLVYRAFYHGHNQNWLKELNPLAII